MENSYEQLDDLFRDIKLLLVSMRQTNPAAVDELKELITQLELWFESLTIDSLRLKKLESMLHRTAKMAKVLQEKLEEGSPDTKVGDIAWLLDENIDSATDTPSEI
jgi:hypothetical protein